MKWFGLILFVGAVIAKHEEYDGYTLYEVQVQDIDQVKLLNQIEGKFHGDVWSPAQPGRSGYVMISKEEKSKFQDALETAGLQYKVERENVKELLDLEDQLLAEATRKSANRTESGTLPFDRIFTYDEVNEYLEQLAAARPDVVTLVLGGYSFEGRPIKYLKISTTNFQDSSKPVVFMESLLHAREWITLPASLYAIEKLIFDIEDFDLLNTIDWIILPIANPDGYIFSHDGNRFWRKNRASGLMIGDLCIGVDLNRNFDTSWSQHSSNLVCSDTFHGRGPFSESETAVVRDIVAEHVDRLELFLDIHSFGSMILYGMGTGVLPPNGLILHLIGVQMATEIDRVKMSWNPNYIVGNVVAILYLASGSAQDYAQEATNRFAFTYELPGYRYGLGSLAGFLVEPDFIEQAGFETWQGIKAGARFVRNNFNNRKA